MKKKYMIPSTTMVQIELQKMIAVSTTGIDASKKEIETQDEDAISGGMGRRHDVWADEEEEDI